MTLPSDPSSRSGGSGQPSPYDHAVDFVALWRSELFRRQVTHWVDGVFVGQGELRSGPLEEFRVRFWSGVFRVPMRSGTAWFKVANGGQAFEGPLLAALSRVAPGRVIRPWAVEPVEGWSLLPDGGPTLDRESEEDWLGLISDVAVLQRHCQPHVAELTMLPSFEAADAADQAEQLLTGLAGLSPQHPQHLDPSDVRRCTDGLPRLRDQLAVLARLGRHRSCRPMTLSPPTPCARALPASPGRLFDLGDAVWSHPWAVLHSPGREIAKVRLSDPWPQARSTQRLVDAYAEHWPEIDRSDRAAVLEAAKRLGALHRAESWRRLSAETDPDKLGMPSPRLATWLVQTLA